MGCHNPPPGDPFGVSSGSPPAPPRLGEGPKWRIPSLGHPGNPRAAPRDLRGGILGTGGGAQGLPLPFTPQSLLGLPFLTPPHPLPEAGQSAGRSHTGEHLHGAELYLGGAQFAGCSPPHLRPRLLRAQPRSSCAAAPAPTSPGCVRASTTRHRQRPRPRWNQNWGGGQSPPSPPPLFPGAGLGGQRGLERAGKRAGAAGAHCPSFSSFSSSSGSFLRVKKPSWGREDEDGGDEAAPSPSCWVCVPPPCPPPRLSPSTGRR